MIEEFKEMGPYEGQEFEDAVSRLSQYPQLLDNFTDIISRKNRVSNKWTSFHTKGQLKQLLKEVHSYDEFQKKITVDLFLNMIESTSIDHFTFSGLDDLPKDKAFVFVSNHRDIVLDTALLDYALCKSGRGTCEMVIGDNLLVNQFTKDMFKVNGAITIRRSLSSASELREETDRLSRYITHCVCEKQRSVWIAQKSGRSKDGKDETSGAIVKMLYLASRAQGLSFSEFLDKVQIVPVAISYQYDPCDVSKSQEQIRKLKAEGCYNIYKKKKYEDVLDMVRGLRLNKGDVHISVGKPLCGIDNPRDAVREIDRQIHLNYRLCDTNYFAYDYINGTERFKDKYESLNTKSFVKHYSGLNKDVVDMVYLEYANPVISMLNETES